MNSVRHTLLPTCDVASAQALRQELERLMATSP